MDVKLLGTLRPAGGGDPIPLTKEELRIGRRPSNDIKLDFENVSGKHCVLRYAKGIWTIRDLGSTNGTTLNGIRLTNEHQVMPDDDLAIASHHFRLDYEPFVPESMKHAEELLEVEAELYHTDKGDRKSLMELAGLGGRGGGGFERDHDRDGHPHGRDGGGSRNSGAAASGGGHGHGHGHAPVKHRSQLDEFQVAPKFKDLDKDDSEDLELEPSGSPGRGKEEDLKDEDFLQFFEDDIRGK